MRSFLIGSAIMCVAYMIPFLGFVTWALAGVFGLGAATLAFFTAYRRENPKPPEARASRAAAGAAAGARRVVCRCRQPSPSSPRARRRPPIPENAVGVFPRRRFPSDSAR